MAIPKIIHQTYASANVPAEIAANIERLQAMNPGWQYAFYDDAAIEVFIRRYYDLDMLALYQRINPVYGAARADFFRYLLVYQFGGVYLDIKSTALQPLDTLIAPQDRYVLAYWPNAQGEPFEAGVSTRHCLNFHAESSRTGTSWPSHTTPSCAE